MKPALHSATGIRIYFGATLLITAVNLAGFIAPELATNPPIALYCGLVVAGQSMLFLLLTIPVIWCISHALSLLSGRHNADNIEAVLFAAAAILIPGIMQFLIYTDKIIHRMYGFHINGFVLNIITTKGGIASLGAGNSTVAGTLAIAGLFILLHAAVYIGSVALDRRRILPERLLPRRVPLLVAGIVGVIAAEKIVYGICHLQAYTPVLAAANQFPLYMPLTIRSLAKKLGFEPKRHTGIRLQGKAHALNYPRQSVRVTPTAATPNIVMLVAESLRADMLDAEIMPATWKLARRSLWGQRHYSGGNGTRMGIFSLFYGLPANYWFPMLEQQRPPVLMDEITRRGYQLGLYTSARFTYPEFDRTVFAGVDASLLHEYDAGHGWQRDEHNVGQLIDFIGRRDPAKPFMSFIFFESPHARYFFPETAVIRPDYLQEFNYATADIARDIHLIKNRYINSVHYLDTQIARLLEYLESQNLMTSTIVLIVGDHGEEFMEKGRWGHNSHFSEEQIRTPLVLWVPGQNPLVLDRMTSHIDVAPTMLTLLGVENPPADYCLGFNLLGSVERPYTLVGDWSYLAYLDGRNKVVTPFRATNMTMTQVFRHDDSPVEDSQEFLDRHPEVFKTVLESMTHFGR